MSQQTGLKYRQKIEQKLSLKARQPTGDLCDLDPLDEEVFQAKNAPKIANKVMSQGSKTNGIKKKKVKKNQKKNPLAVGWNRKTNMSKKISTNSNDE